MVDTTTLKEIESMLDSLDVLQCKVETIPDDLTKNCPNDVSFTGESVRNNLLKTIRNARINCASIFYFFMSTLVFTDGFDREKHKQLEDRMEKMCKTFLKD